MNNPLQNNYIQYATKLNIVKTKSVVFVDNGINTTFRVEGIIEEFFILAVFQNNVRILGVGFDDLENNDMLGFINSELTDLQLIPQNAFLASEQIVTMSYNNEYLKSLSNSVPNSNSKNKHPQLLFLESYIESDPNLQAIIAGGVTYKINPIVKTVLAGAFLPPINTTLYFCNFSLTGNHILDLGYTEIIVYNGEHKLFISTGIFPNNCQIVGWEVVFSFPIHYYGGGAL